MAKLKFNQADVLRCMEHALAAPEHNQSFVENMDNITPKAALWLVKDDGIYVMSNGKPQDKVKRMSPNGKHEIDGCFVAYANGYDPTKGEVWDKCRAAVGGDDFVENLELSDGIIEALRSGDDLVVDITSKHIKILTLSKAA